MNTSIKISVIIPTYNRADTIEYCLKSVLNQTYPPHEIIIVDDCSTDNTIEVINSFAENKIKIFALKENSGAQVARNTGIEKASGDWIAFQDSDDEWDLQKLEKQVRSLANYDYNPFTVVHTNCLTFNYDSKVFKEWNIDKVEGSNVFSDLLRKSGPLFPTILTSKLALEKIGYLDASVKSYQEWDLAIRLALYCRFIHLKEPLFIYHLHSGETISKDLTRDIEGYHFNRIKFEKDIKRQLGSFFYNIDIIWNLLRALNFGLFDYCSTLIKSTPIVKQGLIRNYLDFLIKHKIKPKYLFYFFSKLKESYDNKNRK